MEHTGSSSSSGTPNKRCVDTTIAMPIIFGNSAFYLGKKAHETATHRWTLFVRSPNGEDLSSFISKVAFSLHESFAEPVRVIEKAPFEVTELGWYVYVRMCIHMCVFMCICVHACLLIYTYVCVYIRYAPLPHPHHRPVCRYVGVYVCVCVCLLHTQI